LKNEPRLLLKKPSNFYLALDSINQSDSLILTYLDAKNIVSYMSPFNLAGGLNYYLTENNEYFAKRIFIMDMND
jgi:hypothetical protein